LGHERPPIVAAFEHGSWRIDGRFALIVTIRGRKVEPAGGR
jgi:hypothetical protein